MEAEDGCIGSNSVRKLQKKNGFGKKGFLNGAMIAFAKIDVKATTFAEEVEAEWVTLWLPDMVSRVRLSC